MMYAAAARLCDPTRLTQLDDHRLADNLLHIIQRLIFIQSKSSLFMKLRYLNSTDPSSSAFPFIPTKGPRFNVSLSLDFNVICCIDDQSTNDDR